MKALEVESNNADRDEANETDSESEPYTTGIQSATGTPASLRLRSATGTPASVRSQSVVSTPTSLRLRSLASTPTSVWSRSAVSTPGSATPPSRSQRSQSVDSRIPTNEFRARFDSTPAFDSLPKVLPTRTPDSAPPASCYQQYWSTSAPASPFTAPQLTVPAVRQQASLPTGCSTIITGEYPVPQNIEKPISSSTSSWDFKKCILHLKGTSAASKWKFLGRRLGVTEGDIEAIDENCHSDLQEKFYQMMQKWKSVKGELATKEDLIEALRGEKLNAIAETL